MLFLNNLLETISSYTCSCTRSILEKIKFMIQACSCRVVQLSRKLRANILVENWGKVSTITELYSYSYLFLYQSLFWNILSTARAQECACGLFMVSICPAMLAIIYLHKVFYCYHRGGLHQLRCITYSPSDSCQSSRYKETAVNN